MLIQSATANNGAGATATCTVNLTATTANSLIFIGIMYKSNGGATVSQVEDNLGNLYNNIAGPQTDTNHYSGTLFYGTNLPGVTSITVTMSAACVINMEAAEESDCKNVPGNIGSTGSGNSATYASGFQTEIGPCVVYGLVTADNANTFTNNDTMTIVRQDQNGTDGDATALIRGTVPYNVSPGASVQVAGTISGSCHWAALFAGFYTTNAAAVAWCS
jgi:hypothetical protein